jgi:hypothetical protein
MTDSNYVYEKGTLFVAPGGGSAPVPLAPGAANQALFANPASENGVEWGDGSAMGNVVGPVSSVAHNLSAFADTSGVLLEDSGIATDDVALGAGSSTAGNLVSFANTDGKTMADSGKVAASVVIGPASATDNALPRYDSTTGKLIQGSNTVLSDTDVMTFPANGGVVLGAGARKGTFTFASGTHAKILTAAAVTGSIIVYTISSLGTVTAPQAILTTIDTGVGFTPVSADATDTSTCSWAIVG